MSGSSHEQQGLRCPECGTPESDVTDSRYAVESIRRRRECEECKKRFTTRERIENPRVQCVVVVHSFDSMGRVRRTRTRKLRAGEEVWILNDGKDVIVSPVNQANVA